MLLKVINIKIYIIFTIFVIVYTFEKKKKT